MCPYSLIRSISRQVDLDAFTAMPRPDDILLYALPVCAPYFALQAYKYKVSGFRVQELKIEALESRNCGV